MLLGIFLCFTLIYAQIISRKEVVHMEIIKLEKPIFKCQMDEDIFFQRLAELADVDNITESDNLIFISISRKTKPSSVLKELTDIANMWNSHLID